MSNTNEAAAPSLLETVSNAGVQVLKDQPDMRFAFETNAAGDLRVGGEHRPVASILLTRLMAEHKVHSPGLMRDAFNVITEAVANTGRPVTTEQGSNGRQYTVIQPVGL